jgi:hypothetical protein
VVHSGSVRLSKQQRNGLRVKERTYGHDDEDEEEGVEHGPHGESERLDHSVQRPGKTLL